MSDVAQLRSRLRQQADVRTAANLQRFFKTRPGEYGEGDVFLGIKVPPLRKLAKTYQGLDRKAVIGLLRSDLHEERLLALLILVGQFKQGDNDIKQEIYQLYLKHTRHINNWDLVDASAGHIVGAYLFRRNKQPLYDLAQSKSLWERRIAIMATLHFIKQDRFSETLKIAKRLLNDPHDLIHKAVGWMLREVGKREPQIEESFLQTNYTQMPRTMLRYAIERFPENKRQRYLQGRI